jgi:hypothetical protein
VKLALEIQTGPIEDETRARIAMVRPILRATLYALSLERVERLGGYAAVTLHDLAREWREGDGDCGICFEYAIHEAIERRDPLLVPRVGEVLESYCAIKGDARSILFGAEKGARLELLKTDRSLLTPQSRLVVSERGRPIRFKTHLDRVRRAFSVPKERELLPRSIRGLWRADLFVGAREEDRWVATTLKLNPAHLEGAAGIRIGIYPERRRDEHPSFDPGKNLVLCPVPYDGGFMEAFYSAFVLAKKFLASDAQVPPPDQLPFGMDRFVAKLLEQRRGFPVLDVIRAFEDLAQPGLLLSDSAGEPYSESSTSAVAPVARPTVR